ncbi:MAG: hypothetical protein MJ072_02740, partial [Clostridia bacterium]|nr:hypothetical protein [Clostridia bacterium]
TYFDGNSGVTGDTLAYSFHVFNDKRINTAAIRLIRYLALSEPSTYKFNIEKVGMLGNSKGGWFRFLGEDILQRELVDATKYATTRELEIAIITTKPVSRTARPLLTRLTDLR